MSHFKSIIIGHFAYRRHPVLGVPPARGLRPLSPGCALVPALVTLTPSVWASGLLPLQRGSVPPTTQHASPASSSIIWGTPQLLQALDSSGSECSRGACRDQTPGPPGLCNQHGVDLENQHFPVLPQSEPQASRSPGFGPSLLPCCWENQRHMFCSSHSFHSGVLPRAVLASLPWPGHRSLFHGRS